MALNSLISLGLYAVIGGVLGHHKLGYNKVGYWVVMLSVAGIQILTGLGN